MRALIAAGLFLCGVGLGYLIQPGVGWWREESTLEINDPLLAAISAYVGVPPEQITDAHIAYLLRHALSAEPPPRALRPLYEQAIGSTFDRHQPMPRRPGASQ